MPTLREVREKRFLTQQELAEAAKVSKSTVANIELGLRRPRIPTARKLAAALSTPPGEIDWPDAPEEGAVRRANKSPGTPVTAPAEREARS